MFKCIRCEQIHLDDSKAKKIFFSGYVLIEERKVPLGICKGETKKYSGVFPLAVS